MKFLMSVAAVALVVSSGMAQTPPIQPKTVDVPLPPALQLPGPDKIDPNIPNRPMTANEAAAIALRLQPDVAIASAQVRAAQGRTDQVRSNLYPNVSVGAGFTSSRDFRGGTTGGSGSGSQTSNTGFTSSLTLNQLLFDFNVTRDQVRQQEALARAQELNLTRTQADLVLEVKRDFYAFVQANQLVAVAEANLASDQNQLDLAQARLDSGLGAPSDVVRAKTAVSDASVQVTTARENALAARILLAQTMGVDPRTPLQPADSSEPELSEADLGALVDQALAHRPEILQAQQSLRAAGIGVSIARRALTPAIGLSLGLTGRGDSDPLSSQRGTLGISLNWTVLDSGFARGLTKEARANEDIAKAQLTQISQTVVADVANAFVIVQSAQQRVTSATAGVANAEEGVRLAEGRYRAGLATFIEVTDAQAALVQARTSQVNAVANLQQARAALDRAIGNRPATG